jgi:hypothetical protein
VVVAATAVAAAPVPGEAALAALLACAAGTGWSKTPATEHLAAADAPVFLAARSLACASLSSSFPIAASSSAVPLAPVAFPASAYLLSAFRKTCDLSSLLPCPFFAALFASGAVSSAAALDVAVVECFCPLRCWLDQLAYSSSAPSLSSMQETKKSKQEESGCKSILFLIFEAFYKCRLWY